MEKFTFRRIREAMGHRPEVVIPSIASERERAVTRDEFIALSLWLEGCFFLHILETEAYPPEAGDHIAIPDLFALYQINDGMKGFLIHVECQNRSTLSFAERRLEGLRRYGVLHHLPLLIAWRHFGDWFLVDGGLFEKGEGRFHLSLERAMKNNLMDLVLGNFVVSQMKAGIRWRWKLPKGTRTAFEEIPEEEMKKFLETVGDFYYENLRGEKVAAPLRSPLFLMLLYGGQWRPLTYEEDQSTVEGEDLLEGSDLPAYRILQIAEYERALKRGKEVPPWLEIAKERGYRYSLEAVKESIELAKRRDLGCEYVMAVRPETLPPHLKDVE
jgi:hypothetical protein